MTTKRILLGSLLGAGLFYGGVLFGQRPAENINPQRHPNLAAAQKHLAAAWGSAEEARKENKDELGGHASKAQEHMSAADMELKAAAEFADHRK